MEIKTLVFTLSLKKNYIVPLLVRNMLHSWDLFAIIHDDKGKYYSNPTDFYC